MRAPLRPGDADTMPVRATIFKASRAQRAKKVSPEHRVKAFFRAMSNCTNGEERSHLMCDDYEQAAYGAGKGEFWPISCRASWNLVNTWLWFSTGRVTPLVAKCCESEAKVRVGTFKDAAIAWPQIPVQQQLELLSLYWLNNEVSRHIEKCEAYDREAAGANAKRGQHAYSRLDGEVLAVLAWERGRRACWLGRGGGGTRAAVTIQRRWRHRCWRVKELWNPATEAGKRWISAIASSRRWAAVA